MPKKNITRGSLCGIKRRAVYEAELILRAALVVPAGAVRLMHEQPSKFELVSDIKKANLLA
jgi:hypothetical protein